MSAAIDNIISDTCALCTLCLLSTVRCAFGYLQSIPMDNDSTVQKLTAIHNMYYILIPYFSMFAVQYYNESYICLAQKNMQL